MKPYAIFDTELIGTKKPVFLIKVRQLKPRKTHAFWLHRRGDLDKFEALLPKFTFVGFNSDHFDRPLIAAALMGHDANYLKVIAENIITRDMRSFETYREFKLDFVEYDHIDLFEVAPGVKIGLKVYEGRMAMQQMMDMPFHHSTDLKPSQYLKVEEYCDNDIDATEALMLALKTEIAMREEMSAEYNIDFRSKSDAQIAEAIFKSRLGLKKSNDPIPQAVHYIAPKFITSKNTEVQQLVYELERHRFLLHQGNGAPEVPEFLKEPRAFGKGTYQVGVGGLHSTHDTQLHLKATEQRLLSDFDVVSYYPNIMMKAGLIPRLKDNKGAQFLQEYKRLYDARIDAKRAGNKKVANSLKIALNGTFGKLGSLYCSFYSPDLLLAVTLTGQLNLLCLIVELDKIKGVKVESANTDGVLVSYPPELRYKVLGVFAGNAKRTGFEYEETPYSQVAMKDVNNYIAFGLDGKIKRKGLYASSRPEENQLYLQKNPSMDVCTALAIDALLTGEMDITKYKEMRDYVAVRGVTGGGIQFDRYKLVDDWESTDEGWVYPGQTTKPVKRKSRPPPREIGVGGVPFGRVARWYMTTESLPPLSYVKSGNQVPKTEGAKVCMQLPKKLPADLDRKWYIDAAFSILDSCGVCQSQLQSVKVRTTK